MTKHEEEYFTVVASPELIEDMEKNSDMYMKTDAHITFMNAVGVPFINENNEIEKITVNWLTKCIYMMLQSRVEGPNDRNGNPHADFARSVGKSRSTLAKHLKILERTGLIEVTRRPGKTNLYKMNIVADSKIIMSADLFPELYPQNAPDHAQEPESIQGI